MKAGSTIFSPRTEGLTIRLKTIRTLFTDNRLLIDRGITFQVNIIRSAERIRIQTGVLSRSRYYRIFDAAIRYRKPVRYFTCASASKGAMQVMKADQ